MSFNKLLQQSLLWRGFYFFTVLLLNIAISRILRADGSGGLYFSTIVFNFILLIVSFNLESGFTYFASSNKIPYNSLALLGTVWAMVSVMLLAPVTFFYLRSITYLHGITALRLTYNASTFIMGVMLTNYFTVLFYSKKNFFIPNILLGGSNILLLVFFVVGQIYHLHNNTLVTIYFLFYPLQGVVLTVLFFISHKKEDNFRLPSKTDFNLLVRYSTITLVGNLAFNALYRVDYLFVNKFCSQSDLGNYIQAAKLGQMLLIIPQILASAIYPQIASGGHQEYVLDSIIILFRLFLQVFGVLLIILIIIGRWLFPFAFGNTFNSMFMPMQIIIPGLFSLSALALLSAFFSGKGKPRINMEGALIGLIITLVCDWFLVPLYGINAAAAVSTLSYVANLAYSLWHFNKITPLETKDMFAFSKNDWRWVFGILTSRKNKPGF